MNFFPNQKPDKKDNLLESLKQLKGYFIYAALFSASVNLLMLTPIMYMLQVYDRVVSSGSMTTLSMLTLLMLLLLVSSGGFEWVRSKLLIAANVRLEESLREQVSESSFKQVLLTGDPNNSSRTMSDLIGLRQFVTGNGVFAIMDAPWTPIYIGVMFMFHPLFGLAAIITTIILIILALVSQKVATSKLALAANLTGSAQSSFSSNLRNAEVIHGMGMAANIRAKDNSLYAEACDEQANASAVVGRLAAISKSFRLISQSILLGLGAYLALRGQISPGMMIAGSLLLGRALAPIDLLVASWRGFVEAKAQFDRLRSALNTFPADSDRLSLPPPTGELSVENLVVAPPLSRIACLKGVSFKISAGEALGIIGPSAAGKTSLARAILGIWRASSGAVRLDNAEIDKWDREELGPYLGYLPQDIELFDGSIADNICRFNNHESEKIIEAAEISGIHDMVLRLPESYETRINASSGALSAGQRQRLGLARAIYGKPKLIVLDEPNSNLDEEGEHHLLSALQQLKESGSTVIVITHRTPILALADKLLVLKNGLVATFGARDEVIKSIHKANTNITKLPQTAAPR
ncbi:MAG: type I secretion system permease/ATPase [Flammeovirgaceae bacterium TMED32]|nr:MAG: type I secretion system permease/ATPase [Flammeovirgaceae bacterium TMED32]